MKKMRINVAALGSVQQGLTVALKTAVVVAGKGLNDEISAPFSALLRGALGRLS